MLITPGSNYHHPKTGVFRLTFSLARPVMRQALQRLERALGLQPWIEPDGFIHRVRNPPPRMDMEQVAERPVHAQRKVEREREERELSVVAQPKVQVQSNADADVRTPQHGPAHGQTQPAAPLDIITALCGLTFANSFTHARTATAPADLSTNTRRQSKILSSPMSQANDQDHAHAHAQTHAQFHTQAVSSAAPISAMTPDGALSEFEYERLVALRKIPGLPCAC